ncbi:MAG: hypothetical protein AAF500_22255, partial [Myxococcota bacterium]
MTKSLGSRTPASIRGGATPTRRWATLCLVVIGACDAQAPRRDESDPLEFREPPAPPQTKQAEAPEASLERIDVYGATAPEAGGSRVVLLFEGAPLFHEERLPAEGVLPNRIAIDLVSTTVAPTVTPFRSVGRGGVTRVRLARPEPRVVIDLEPGAKARTFYLTDPYRVVIDVSRERAETRSSGQPVVVIDPGHGGAEPGAANDELDLVESIVALDIAKLTRDRLNKILPWGRGNQTRGHPPRGAPQ